MGYPASASGFFYEKATERICSFSNEDDFLKAFACESCEVDGVHYRVFHWNTDFCEESEHSLVPVWIFLPGLSPNFYHETLLRSIVSPMGKFLRRDNSTKCATRMDGARVCIEMDASVDPITGFWIGTPQSPNSWYQEVEYETLPAYCQQCKVQGHLKKKKKL